MAYSESCSTILGLPDVPDEKYMSMGSAAAVSRRSKSSDAARTHVLKSSQPARSTPAAHTPSGPDSALPSGRPSSGNTRLPSASSGVRPPPAPFTRMRRSSVGHASATRSHTSAMSPSDVAMTALTDAPFRRYSRSCSLSMKVAGTMTAPSFASAVATNQNW